MDKLKLPCNCGRSTSGFCLGQQILTAKPPEGHLGSWTPPCDYDLQQTAIEAASSESAPE
jgi:hypothetical protein